MPVATQGYNGKGTYGNNKTTTTTTTNKTYTTQTAAGRQGLGGLGGKTTYTGTYGHGGGGTQAYNQGFTRGVAAIGGGGGTAMGFQGLTGLNRGMGNTQNTGNTARNPFTAAAGAPTVANRANPALRGSPTAMTAPRGTIDYLNQQQAMKAGVNMARTPNYRTAIGYQPNYNVLGGIGQANVVTKPGQGANFADFYGGGAPARGKPAPLGAPAPAKGAPTGLTNIFTPGAQMGYDPSAKHSRVIDTMIAEAKLRDPQGLLSVAHVMNNRSKYSGADIYDVVSAPNAFSGFDNPGDDAKTAMRDPAIRARAEQAFQDAVTGRVPDPTGGADYFRTPTSSYGSKMQNKLAYTTSIGGHDFFVGPKGDLYRTQGGDRGGGVIEVGGGGSGRGASRGPFVSSDPEQDFSAQPLLASQQMAADRAAKMPYATIPGTQPQFQGGGIGSDKDAGLYGPAKAPYTPGTQSYTPKTDVPRSNPQDSLFYGNTPREPEHYSPFTDARAVERTIATQRAISARSAHLAERGRVAAAMMNDFSGKDEPVSTPRAPPGAAGTFFAPQRHPPGAAGTPLVSRGEDSYTPKTPVPQVATTRGIGPFNPAGGYSGTPASEAPYLPENSPQAPGRAPPNSAAAMDLRGIDPATLDQIQLNRDQDRARGDDPRAGMFATPPSRGEDSYTPRTDVPRSNPGDYLYYGDVSPAQDAYLPENSPRAASAPQAPYAHRRESPDSAYDTAMREQEAARNPIQAAAEGGFWENAIETITGGIETTGDFANDPMGTVIREAIKYAAANPSEAAHMAARLAQGEINEAVDATGREVGEAMSAFTPRFVNAASMGGGASELVKGGAWRDPVERAFMIRNLQGTNAAGWANLNEGNPTEMQKTVYSQKVAGTKATPPNFFAEPGYTPPNAPQLATMALGPAGSMIEFAKSKVKTGDKAGATAKAATPKTALRAGHPPNPTVNKATTAKPKAAPYGMAERARELADARGQPRNRKVNTVSIPYAGDQGAVTMPAGDYSSPKTAPWKNDLPTAITQAASILQVDAVDLAGIIHFESGFNPAVKGGKNGVHVGLIQFGKAEQKQYGITTASTVAEQMQAATQFALDRGFIPGVHGAAQLYATINTGSPSGGHKSDTAAGGTWGSADDKFFSQMDGSRAKGAALLGTKAYTGGFGGTGTMAFGQNLQDVTNTGQRGATAQAVNTNVFTGTKAQSTKNVTDPAVAMTTTGAFQPNYVQATAKPPAAKSYDPNTGPRTPGTRTPGTSGDARIAQLAVASPGTRAHMTALTERLQSYRGRDHAGSTITLEEVEAFLMRKSPKVLNKLSLEGKLELLAEAGRTGDSNG